MLRGNNLCIYNFVSLLLLMERENKGEREEKEREENERNSDRDKKLRVVSAILTVNFSRTGNQQTGGNDFCSEICSRDQDITVAITSHHSQDIDTSKDKYMATSIYWSYFWKEKTGRSETRWIQVEWIEIPSSQSCSQQSILICLLWRKSQFLVRSYANEERKETINT